MAKVIGLSAGTYDVFDTVATTTTTVTVPVLTAGAIANASPTIGDTLTVTGSNASARATYQWQDSADNITFADIVGETAATLDTTGLTADTYFRRGVADGEQAMVYTAGVQVGAAAVSFVPTDLGAKLLSWLDLTDTSTLWQDTGRTTPATTVSDNILYVDDKSANGNDFSATSGNTPGNAVVIAGGADWNNVGMEIASGSAVGLTSTAEVYALIDLDGDTALILVGKDGTSGGGGFMDSGNASTTISDFGGTVTVDNIALVAPTRDDVYTEFVAAGAGYNAFGINSINLTSFSGSLMAIGAGNPGTDLRFAGNVRHFIITTALTAGERADLNTFLQAES